MGERRVAAGRLLVAVAVVGCAVALVGGAMQAGALPSGSAGAPSGIEWVCNPAMASDPCDLPSDTTDLLTGEVTTKPPVADANKQVDCFFVYPTVANQVNRPRFCAAPKRAAAQP